MANLPIIWSLTSQALEPRKQGVPTKNSISANPGLATGFWKPLAVRVNERRWFSLLNRERSPTGPVAMVSCFGRVDG
jgi:hypothetical protein